MFYGWYVLIACVLISMYFSGTIYLGFTTIFEPIALEMGWSYAQISFAASLRGFETGVLILLSGIIVDRWGARKLIFGGSLISGIGLIMLSRVESLPMFYVSFGVICVGVSSAPTPILMSVVANWFRKHQGLAMGITSSGVALGGLLIPLITALVDTLGWRRAMGLVGLGVLLIPMPLSLILRHKPEQYGYQPDGEEFGISDYEDKTNHEKRQRTLKGVLAVLSSRVFWIIAAAFLFHVMALSTLMTHIMPFFSHIGLERSKSSFLISAIPIVGIIGRVGFGWLGDQIDKMKIATLALILTGLGVIIFMYITLDRLWLVGIFIVIFGIGWGGLVPMLPGLVIKYFGKDNIGTFVGAVSSVMMLGMITGAPIAGWIFDIKGSYHMVWSMMGSILIAMTFVFYFVLHGFEKKMKSPDVKGCGVHVLDR